MELEDEITEWFERMQLDDIPIHTENVKKGK